nr:unnamed protein product [Callosobruchus analis]
MVTQDFRDFSITTWYEQFKHICPESLLIEIPRQVIEKFQDDEEEVNAKNCPEQFKEELLNALNSLNKSAFIKNNWHAPTDARMFSFDNNLKAVTVDDILMYLNSSLTIREDFDTVRGVPFCLCLRKWINIHPAAEFRLIIVNNLLRGITPRDWPTYYTHYKEESNEIIEELANFYNENVKIRFPRQNYIVDVVYSYPDKPYILDFGPLNNKTNLYAFTWKEIQPLLQKECPEDVAPVFRYLENDIGIMSKADALRKFSNAANN